MRKYLWVFVVLVILIVSVIAYIAVIPQTNCPTVTSSSQVLPALPIGAFLYLWYGSPGPKTGLDTPGWNSSSYPGGGAVVDTPATGYYASDDNQTFACQVDQMQKAGLSFAVISWWGPSTHGESELINRATHDFFAFLKSTGSTFRAAIMVDAYNGTSNLSNSSLESDYSYVYSSFVKPYGNWYFDWEGKPLLLFFNPVYPSYDNATYTVRTIGNRPNSVDWVFWDAPAQYFQGQAGDTNATNDEGQPLISADGEVTLVPRIDSHFDAGYSSGSYLRFDQSLSLGLYQEQWNYVIDHRSQIGLVLIYSWNEYHERSAIEPHADFTADVGSTYLLNLTAYYVSALG